MSGGLSSWSRGDTGTTPGARCGLTLLSTRTWSCTWPVDRALLAWPPCITHRQKNSAINLRKGPFLSPGQLGSWIVCMLFFYIWKKSPAHTLGGISGVASFIHYHWWTVSIKLRLQLSLCRLCFWKTLPYSKINPLTDVRENWTPRNSCYLITYTVNLPHPEGLGIRYLPHPKGLGIRYSPHPEGLGIRYLPHPEGLGIRYLPHPEGLGIRYSPHPEGLGIRYLPHPEGLAIRYLPHPVGLGIRYLPHPDRLVLATPRGT